VHGPHGSPDSLVEAGTEQAAAILGDWVARLAGAAGSTESAAEIRSRIEGEAARIDPEPLVEAITRAMLHGAMLGALDCVWERETQEEVPLETFRAWAEPILMDRGQHDGEPFTTLSFEKALKLFEQRQVMTRAAFDKLGEGMKRTAFTIAGLAKQELLEEAHGALAAMLKESPHPYGGPNLLDFKAFAQEHLEASGWTPANPSHVETIYRTNIATAYGSGAFVEMRQPATLAARPYWQWRSVGDSRSRPTHAANNGKVLRADSPTWQRVWYPAGFNCRCRTVARSARWVEANGVEVADDLPGLPDPGYDCGTGSLPGGEEAADTQAEARPGPAEQRNQEPASQLGPPLVHPNPPQPGELLVGPPPPAPLPDDPVVAYPGSSPAGEPIPPAPTPTPSTPKPITPPWPYVKPAPPLPKLPDPKPVAPAPPKAKPPKPKPAPAAPVLPPDVPPPPAPSAPPDPTPKPADSKPKRKKGPKTPDPGLPIEDRVRALPVRDVSTLPVPTPKQMVHLKQQEQANMAQYTAPEVRGIERFSFGYDWTIREIQSGTPMEEVIAKRRAHLLSKGSSYGISRKELEEHYQEAMEAVRGLEVFFSKARPTDAVRTVFRGLGGLDDASAEALMGESFTMRNQTSSTSTSKVTAMGFARRNSHRGKWDVLLQLTHKSGVYIDTTSACRGENEVVVPGKATFRTTRLSKLDARTILVEAEEV